MHAQAYLYDVHRGASALCSRALLFFGLAVLSAAVLCADELRIGGEGATLGTIGQLRDAYLRADPEAKIALFATVGTGSAVNALLSGALDVAITMVELTDAERARVSAAEIGRVPFVFAVAKSSKVDDMSLTQLLEMYQGKTPTWRDGSRIRLILRPASVPETIFLKSISPDWKKALEDLEVKPGMVVVATAQEAADRIEKTPGALTTLSASLILTEKRAIKALRIDGVAPSAKAVTDGTYRYFNPLIVAALRKPMPAADRFVAFVHSPAGREVLVRTGHAVSN
jgi:phosphate transport system substrate-binding protein